MAKATDCRPTAKRRCVLSSSPMKQIAPEATSMEPHALSSQQPRSSRNSPRTTRPAEPCALPPPGSSPATCRPRPSPRPGAPATRHAATSWKLYVTSHPHSYRGVSVQSTEASRHVSLTPQHRSVASRPTHPFSSPAPHLEHLHCHVERGRPLPLQDALLHPAPPGLLVGQSHRRHAARQVRQHGVLDHVLQVVAVRRGHQLDAPLR